MKWQDAHHRLLDFLKNNIRTHLQEPQNTLLESSQILGRPPAASRSYQRTNAAASVGMRKNKIASERKE